MISSSLPQEIKGWIIPTEIIFQNNSYRGLISYLMSPKGCHAKSFNPVSDGYIMHTVIGQTWEPSSFSLLNQEEFLPPPTLSSSQTTVEIDPLFGHVMLINQQQNYTIKLFKSTIY